MNSTRTAAALAAAAVTGLTVLTLATPASAAQAPCPWGRHYAPGAGCVHNGMSFEHRNYCPGGVATVKVVGFLPGSSGTVTFGPKGKELGTYTVDAQQVLTGSFTIPAGANRGPHEITVTGVAENGKTTSETRTIRIIRSCAGSDADAVSGPALDAGTTSVNFVKNSADTPGSSSRELGGLAAAGLLLTAAGPMVTRRLRRRTP